MAARDEDVMNAAIETEFIKYNLLRDERGNLISDNTGDKVVDPLELFRANYKLLPLMTEAARFFFAHPPTQLSVERLFSVCGLVDNPRRTRLGAVVFEESVVTATTGVALGVL